MSRRSVFLVLLTLLALPAALPAREGGGDKRLPVIGPAPPFTLTSQDDKPVSLADFHDKIAAVTLTHTGCPDICRRRTCRG